METQILQYDLLWIQSIPSIANIYYHKYLKETHVIHCPDKDLPIRAVARSIMSTLRANETKKMALYFEQPCSDTKRRSIFEFVLKHIPDLTCFCLSVPCAPLQPSLLLGWSAGLIDGHWKRLCSSAYDPEACVPFEPPTTKSGQSACNDFEAMFAMSASVFNKEALIVHFTHHLLSFNADQGLILSENVENAIRGWIEANQHQFKTLIWIIDEKKLYGDAIYNINQEGRDTLLQKYREMVSDKIQSFNDTIPVYSYILDYFHTTSFDLLQSLAQLQHRHSINIAGSTLLTWSNEETTSLNQHSFYTLNCIYLQQKPLFNTSKWKYLHQSSETPSSKDKLKYVSPDMLQLEGDLTNVFRVPLLKSTDNSLPLTKSEEITSDIRHTVSAKTVEVFDSWAELGLKQDLVPISKQDTITSTPNDAGVQPFEAKEKPDEGVVHKQLLQAIIRSLTKRKIGAFIGNTAYMDRGLELKHQVNQLTIDTNEEDDQVRMMGNIPIENSSGIITSTICFSKQDDTYTLVKAKCTCPIGNWGNCKHCAAVMLHALDKRVAMPSQQQPIKEAEPSSPLSTKRSYDASEEDNDSSSNESRKKANASVESSCESASTVAYDPDAPPSAPASHSTDEEGTLAPTFAPNVSPLSNPSLQSVSVYHSSSNERSSASQNSLSSSAKETVSYPSSNSLSDNQQLRESLEQIPESHYEKEEEEEEEESVEIIQQANLNLDAPLMDAGSTDRAHMSSTTEQPTNSQEQDVKHDNDDGDDEDEDDDQLPETQPCF
ncbi:hypothetical protein V8B55DRAFT_1385035 [Mucor lusitanicus]|uniref:SWIM-type domain-containing protein n=1 Tax=Mucor circinelloides f. lusitanicus TaxID=29924 RepID=A0A8H4F2P1_MUCCL|nr:hypothetical protein FB192DRAFT_1084528 [Mucor lusitanicus]